MSKELIIPAWNDIPDNEKPSALRSKFELNEDYFKSWEDSLRDHQTECVWESMEVKIGQASLPTSTGKTMIQMYLHVEDMISKTKNGNVGTYVIGAHRLTLCTQLFDDFLSLIIPCGLRTDMIYVGSERYNFSKLNEQYKGIIGFLNAGVEGEQTLDPKRIAEIVERSHKDGKHALIVSTYHSFDKLADLKHIDMATFDEAHTTITDNFTENIKLVKPIIDKQYFFTATINVKGEHGGQNDEEFYGRIMYELSPREAQERGEIVWPVIHELTIDSVDPDIGTSQSIKTVKEAFDAHYNEVKKSSAYPEKIGAKLLVTVNGLKELHTIHGDSSFQEWCKENRIRVFAFSSDEGCFIDFVEKSRLTTLREMSVLPDKANAILFHYDMLTEGINLPSITGVLLLRDPSDTKFWQTIGRGGRLVCEDRMKIYSGEIQPNETEKMIKPFNFIIIPHYPNIDHDHLERRVNDLIETYNIPLENIGKIDRAIADKEKLLDRLNSPGSKIGKQYDITHVIKKRRIDQMKIEFDEATNKSKYLKKQLRKGSWN